MSVPIENDNSFIAYKLAITARNIHYENYEKWMTFYYVSVGAILVAYYQIKPDIFFNCLLSLIGFLVSAFWHLSCKGFKFWTDNWIMIIWKYEKEFQNRFPNTEVYSIFSNEVYDKQSSSPFKGADISTPKVTLLFSFLVSWIWQLIFLRTLSVSFIIKKSLCLKYFVSNNLTMFYISISLLSFAISFFCIWIILKLNPLKNRVEKTHTFFY
jgi:hypothetical protein